MFDTGGGSSQFTFGHAKEVDERFSVNVGAARFTERFGLDGAVSEETLAAALEAIAGDLARLDGRPVPDALIGMGGAVTNLAAVKHQLIAYDAEVVQGTVLDLDEIDRQIKLYRTSSADERSEIVGLRPQRSEVILAGACIVRTVIAKLGCYSSIVSDRTRSVMWSFARLDSTSASSNAANPCERIRARFARMKSGTGRASRPTVPIDVSNRGSTSSPWFVRLSM